MSVGNDSGARQMESEEKCIYCNACPQSPAYEPYCSKECSAMAAAENDLDENQGDVVSAAQYPVGKSSMTEEDVRVSNWSKATDTKAVPVNAYDNHGKPYLNMKRVPAKTTKEGEATQSAGSLFGGPTGSIGEEQPDITKTSDTYFGVTKEADLGIQGFNSFQEAEKEKPKGGLQADQPASNFTKATGTVPGKRKVTTTEMFPVYECYDGRGRRYLSRIPPRLVKDDVTCPNCGGKKESEKAKYCTKCAREIALGEDTDGIMTESTAPTLQQFWDDITERGLPVRYHKTETTIKAESQDKATIHQISVLASAAGLSAKADKSLYDDWDSTWVLSVTGFKR